MDAITVCSPSFNPNFSYGIIANAIVEGLKQRDIHVNYVCSDANEELPDNRFKFTPYSILMGHPVHFKYYGNIIFPPQAIAVTMFESTELPKGWVDILNAIRGVVVPSKFCEEVFSNQGVKSPIAVSPLGVNSIFAYKPREKSIPFRFLATADRGDRKNWMGAGNAFGRAFKLDPNIQLVLKSMPDFKDNFLDPNFVVIRRSMTTQQMAALYQSCHALIFPSKGEGFGWPPLEMLRTGGVAISTAFGGLDWAAKYGSVVVPHKMAPAWLFDEFAGCGEWGEPDEEALVEALLDVYHNYNKHIEGARERSLRIERDLTWEPFIDTVLGMWD